MDRVTNESTLTVSVVLPVYSETETVRETIKILLRDAVEFIKEILIIISPKSTSQSFRVCESLVDQYPNLIKLLVQKNNPGLGWAYREGMELAQHDYVVLMNADLETEPEAVIRMIKKIQEKKCDGVIANRWMPGGGFHNYDRIKLILNWIFQRLFKILYSTKLYDLTFGFKILRKDIVKKITWVSTKHEISTETTLKPLKYGYNIEQVHCFWRGRQEGESKNSFMRNFCYVGLALKILINPVDKLKEPKH